MPELRKVRLVKKLYRKTISPERRISCSQDGADEQ